jgi:hypothetical protein
MTYHNGLIVSGLLELWVTLLVIILTTYNLPFQIRNMAADVEKYTLHVVSCAPLVIACQAQFIWGRVAQR